jgi:hypothetical protein
MHCLNWSVFVPLALLTGLVLAYPTLVFIGLFFLVIPGLVFSWLPTVFVYLVPTLIIRDKLPLRSELAAYLVAFSLTLMLSASFMFVYRIPDKLRFDRAALPDMNPTQKVDLAGDIFLNWPDTIEGQEREVVCDFLCTALLDIPGVTSVTRTCKAGSATFRLGPRNPGTLVVPREPEQLLVKFQEIDPEEKDYIRKAQKQKQQELDVRSLQWVWPLRIARGEELRRDQPLPVEAAEWTIEFVKKRGAGEPSVDRLEIRDKAGKAVVRKTLVQYEVPAPLFHLQFRTDPSKGDRPRPRFAIGTITISNRMSSFDDASLDVLRLTNIFRPTVPQDLGDRVEKIVRDVLNNPKANETQLLMVPTLLGQLPNIKSGNHIDIFARILLDQRIADPWQSLDTLISSETDLTPLRAGLSKRYFNARSEDAKSWYVKKLVRLPDGTFTEPSNDERAIFREALLTNYALPFLERMADQGPSVLPELLYMLRSLRDVSAWHRPGLSEQIRNAFKRLGPDAAPAAPKIIAMIQKSPDDFLDTQDDAIEWLVALRLMGVEEKDLLRTLRHMSSEDAARILAAVNQRVRQQR